MNGRASRARPVRLRLSRKRGFDLKRLSRSINGLEAVVVSRPSRFGNPFRATAARPRAKAVAMFARALKEGRLSFGDAEIREALAGKNLACWCGEGPCHAELLLRIANAKPRVSRPTGRARARARRSSD
ncbi:MAG: DUF4326 domain-containing protein [Alphaproteobacteria bacterium]|nr:DUF4326 domain-containing protein [Alphaproteobacteria bacterium]